MKQIKNTTNTEKIWMGVIFSPGLVYTIPEMLENVWANNSQVITAIANGDALVGDGTINISDVNSAIGFLKNRIPFDVVTSMEKSDKTLRSFCVFAETNSSGIAEVCIPVPSDGRWVAYGDAEFQDREMGDYISILEITDLDRQIAWGMALAANPNATAPVADSVVQANGYPLYPVVGHYDERAFPSTMPANAKGTIRGGMSMTFQYGTTEAQPVGGYGFIPGGFYFRIVAQKATAIAAKKFQVSVDWAQPE